MYLIDKKEAIKKEDNYINLIIYNLTYYYYNYYNTVYYDFIKEAVINTIKKDFIYKLDYSIEDIHNNIKENYI